MVLENNLYFISFELMQRASYREGLSIIIFTELAIAVGDDGGKIMAAFFTTSAAGTTELMSAGISANNDSSGAFANPSENPEHVGVIVACALIS